MLNYKMADYSVKLRFAAIAAICAGLAGIASTPLQFAARQMGDLMSHVVLLGFITLFLIAYNASVAVFLYGIAILGRKYERRTLEICSYFSIALALMTGLILLVGLFIPSIDVERWNFLVNQITWSIVEMMIAILVLPLFARLGWVVVAFAITTVLSNLANMFGGTVNIFTFVITIGLFIFGAMLLFRAARD